MLLVSRVSKDKGLVPGVSEKRKTSVQDLGGPAEKENRLERCSQGGFGCERLLRQAMQHHAGGFICGEKTFNAEFLQFNVERRAQGGERGKQAKRRVLPPVIDGQER